MSYAQPTKITLRGRKLLTVRRIVEERKTNGKRLAPGVAHKNDRVVSAETMVRVYRQEADRQKLLVKKARLTENRLIFVISALKTLLSDENFLTLLRAEELDTMPSQLAERVLTKNRMEHGQADPDRL